MAGPDLLRQDASRVARLGVDAMLDGRRSAIPGWMNRIASLGTHLAPRTLFLPAVREGSGGRVRGMARTLRL